MKRSYTIEMRSAPLEGEPARTSVERFADAILADRHLAGPVAAITGGLQALEVRTSVDAVDVGTAVATATEAFTRAVRKAGLTAEPTVVSAWLDLKGVDFADELIGGGEVARRLGLSRERVRQLSASGRFPTAVGGHERDRMFRWGDVVEWARLNERKVTRPRRRKN